MAFWIIPVFMAMFMMGINHMAGFHAVKTVPNNTTQVIAQQQGEALMAYRNAIEQYLAANPGFTGTIQGDMGGAIQLPYGMAIPPGAGAVVSAVQSSASQAAGSALTVFADIRNSAVSQVTNATNNDGTVGIAQVAQNGSMQMTAPGLGSPVMLPGGVPSGDTVTTLQLNGSPAP